MKIPLFVVVAAVTIASVAVIYGLMSALLPGGPATSTTYTPYTTPTSPHTTTPTTTPPTSTTYTSTYTTTPPPEEKYIETFEEFINLVRYIKWRLRDYDRVDNESKIEIFYYYNKGVEVVGGVEYTRIEFIVEEESGNTTVIIWLPKQTGITPRVMINGEEIPPYMAEYAVAQIVGSFMSFFVIPHQFLTAMILWPYTPPEIGTLTHVSSASISYGNTTLNVDKFVFTPNPNNPDFANITKADIWVSHYREYILCVYFMMETKTSELTYELLEIT
ncbi:MAG: hypothetical protein QXL29_05820 [Zestosphaera sp.]